MCPFVEERVALFWGGGVEKSEQAARAAVDLRGTGLTTPEKQPRTRLKGAGSRQIRRGSPPAPAMPAARSSRASMRLRAFLLLGKLNRRRGAPRQLGFCSRRRAGSNVCIFLSAFGHRSIRKLRASSDWLKWATGGRAGALLEQSRAVVLRCTARRANTTQQHTHMGGVANLSVVC